MKKLFKKEGKEKNQAYKKQYHNGFTQQVKRVDDNCNIDINTVQILWCLDPPKSAAAPGLDLPTQYILRIRYRCTAFLEDLSSVVQIIN